MISSILDEVERGNKFERLSKEGVDILNIGRSEYISTQRVLQKPPYGD